MRTAVCLIALCYTAMAQTPNLVGLPDAKVDLVGTLEAPVIVNHSNTPIIGFVMKKYLGGQSNGMLGEAHKVVLASSLARFPLEAAGILPGDSYAYSSATVAANTIIVKLALDGVLFADGRYVGPDEARDWANGSMAARIKGLRDAGTRFGLPGSDLSEADNMAKAQTIKFQGKNMAEKVGESAQYKAAREISEIRALSGDDEARRAAARFSALPEPRKGN